MAITEPLLDELDFGPFEGRPKKDLMDAMGENWLQHPRNLLLGESSWILKAEYLPF